MKRPRRSAFLALVALTAATHAQNDVGPGETLVYQCDFDENIGSGFTVDPYKQGAKLSNEDRYRGVYSLCCRGNQEYYQYFGRIGKLPLEPGRTYRLRLWSKVSDRPLVIIHIFFHNRGNLTSPPRGASMKISGSKEWRRNDLVFTVPPDLKGGELRFRFCTVATDVVGYFDDLSLVLLAPGLKAAYQCSSKEQIVKVEVNVADFLAEESLATIRVAAGFQSKTTGKILVRREVQGPKAMVSEIPCPIDRLPAGPYEIVVTALTGDGKKLGTRRLDFSVFRDPDWAGNQLGRLAPDADAPPPWPNLRVQGQTVECWGRRYELGSNGLPRQIVALDRGILARPVAIDLQVEGQAATDFTLKPGRASKLKASFEAAGQTRAATVSVQTEIEFDGMLKCTLAIAPKAPGKTRLDKLTLDIALLPQAARLLQRVLTKVSWEGGLAADLTKCDAWKLDQFCPHIWVGTERRGVAWFAESDKGWQVENHPRFQVVKRDDAVIFRVNMIDTPVPLDARREYVFGLQATPTRPAHPRWGDVCFRTKSVKTNTDVIWSNASYDKYYGFPRAADDPTGFKILLAQADYPLRLIYLRNCYEGVPEFKYYEDRWRTDGTVYSLKAAGFDKRHFPIDHTDPLWEDFIVQRIHEWVRRWDINGMYHDCFGPCTKDGALQIFAFRELAKRVYVMHRQLCPDALTIVFAQPLAPLISFSDAILSGEMYRHPLAKHGYYPAFMDLATFRAENVIGLGPARMILPQYKIAYQNSAEHAVHAMGIFLLHDLTVYASWFNMDVYDDIETRRVRFGRRDATFVPYWKLGGRIATSNPALKVSYYEKPNGLFAIVANVTNEDVSAQLRIDLRDLKVAAPPSISIYDALAKKEMGVRLTEDGTMEIGVKRYSMALVEVR